MKRSRQACLFVLLCAVASFPAVAGVPVVPPGFVQTQLPVDIFMLTDFAWDPNGDLWLIAKDGKVEVLRAGASVVSFITTFPNVDTFGERGLVGIAVDPGFLVNHLLYFYYTDLGPPPRNIVLRAEVAGHNLINRTTILSGPPLLTEFHNAGTLVFGPDGTLYISMGDNGLGSPAQDTGTLLGKILRIATDGSVPSDNPFVADPNSRPEVWAYGFRNPFRFNIQPGTGNLFIADVGEATWEELDLGIPGANYGWPLTEGPAPPGVAGVTYPIFSYNHNGGGAAIIGGDHMVAGNFPAQYVGDYFYAEFTQKYIYRLRLDSDNHPISNEPFVTGLPIIVAVHVGPDKALYYASGNFQTIYRLAWVGGTNSQPVAVATATPATGLNPLMVQFDGTGSVDADNDPLTYAWTFGDGGTSTSAAPAHTYLNPGSYTATLTVSDGTASSDQSLRIVSGNRAPTASVSLPVDGSMFNAGDTIPFAGSASDPEDGPLGPSAFSWTVVFHHNTHTHPYLGPISGITSGSFTTFDLGETASDVWYEIILDASDSGAPIGASGVLTTRKSVNIFPNLSTMTFATAPRPDLALKLDSAPITPPLNVTGVVGMKRTVEAPSPQTPGDGHTYTFAGWSDSGARLHQIVTPPSNSVFTATFACNLLQEVTGVRVTRNNTSGDLTLTWTAPPDLCLAGGSAVYHIYKSSTPRPASPPGQFPLDPSFSLIGTTSTTSFTFTPAAASQYYLVVGIGSNGAEGPVGHYGF